MEEGVRWSGEMVGGVLPAGGKGSLCGVLFGGDTGVSLLVSSVQNK